MIKPVLAINMRKMKSTIRFISTTTIRPAYVSDHHNNNELMRRRIELTQSDLLLIQLETIQKGILLQKPQSFSANWIQHLKTTLSKTLDIFYSLAGRLVITQNDDVDLTKSFFVDCNDTGALFVHAVFDGHVTVADILDPVYIPDDVVYSFFPMNGVLNYEGVTKPLLAVQVTELDDGVFFAISMNHSVADGAIFWRFFNTWSQISRDNGVVLDPPNLVFGRDQFFEGIDHIPLRLPFNPNPTQVPGPQPPTLLQQRMFRFSKESIAKLKAKANSEMGTTKISSLQAIMAHLWVSITRNRHHKPDEEVCYTIIVGLRPRTEPPLAEGYFGNAVLFGKVVSTAGKLVENGLGWAAWQMNKMIASQTTQEVREFLKSWAESPKLPELVLESGRRVITGSSPRFNVYGNDFGWGRPLAVRSGPGNKFDGKLTVFEGAEEGSVDFEVCLRSETLQALNSDAEFLEALVM